MALELPFISDAHFILWFGKAIKECTYTIVAGKKGLYLPCLNNLAIYS